MKQAADNMLALEPKLTEWDTVSSIFENIAHALRLSAMETAARPVRWVPKVSSKPSSRISSGGTEISSLTLGN